MPSRLPPRRRPPSGQFDGSPPSPRSVYRSAIDVLLTGVAIIVPIVVTVYVLTVALSFVESALQPIVELLKVTGALAVLGRLGVIEFLVDVGIVGLLNEALAIGTLVGIVVVVGSIASTPQGQRVVDYFDVFVASIPAVGTVYKGFRRMGDIVLDDEVDNFQEVKLVELHGDGTYVIGFVVGESPPVVDDATDDGDDVVTMFVPFAPNPVTGGLLTYVSTDRLRDVDMTVDEGVRNVLTSGVAGHESDRAAVDVAVNDVGDLLERSAPGSIFGGGGLGDERREAPSDGHEEGGREDPGD